MDYEAKIREAIRARMLPPPTAEEKQTGGGGLPVLGRLRQPKITDITVGPGIHQSTHPYAQRTGALDLPDGVVACTYDDMWATSGMVATFEFRIIGERLSFLSMHIHAIA